MGFISREKRLTKEEKDVVYAVSSLLLDGEISFSELEPIIKKHSKIIESHIKKEKEEQQRRNFEMRKSVIKSCKEAVETTKQKLDKCNGNLTELRAELEDQKNKDGYARDENRIKKLLWWIFNNEEDVKFLEKELREKETRMKELEEENY